MRRTSLASTLVASSLLAASAIAAQVVPGAGEGSTTVSATVPLSASAPAQGTHDAVAVAVIGALQAQFDGRDVEFRIDALESKPVSRRDLALTGRGDIRIEGSGAWLPVTFQALYDTATLTVLSPSISLDQSSVEGAARVDSRALEDEVGRRLAAEFDAQSVSFALLDVQVSGGDARHAVASGQGVADFGPEGQAPVQLQGVFDRVENTWIQVDYELGGGDTLGTGLAAL
ncbi:hypothetical protein GCM10028862_00120 [Luteimonas pelagia]